ncbi:hypothetical protein K435DRAFT_870068 [Dendrothele bispora CBS 962.96]|uniref:Uncharacterized protein n=1 Tax=Dendrothele bispora (strain CBS 962.96) TaxID=1314807 RepID=A0A4S8L7K1_DENBC|nr:hypothetical protein K435DRAFT_870068 [Dendrothele bispora CBS 962.96]
MDQFQEDFPPPSTAPNHAERVKLIGTLMDRIEDGLVDVMGRYSVSEEDTRNNFAGIKSGIETALVLLGDIVEQHPCILEAILFSATILFVPEAWIFRPVLSCFGFGPLGPVKGSTAAWAQSRFFGATIDSGSWFSRLQQVAMGGWTLSNLPKIVLGVGAALFCASLSLFLCLLVPQANALDLPEWPLKIAFDEVTSLFNPGEPSKLWKEVGDIGNKVNNLLEGIHTSIKPSVEPLINDLQSKISSVTSSLGLQALRTELETHLLAMHNSTCEESGGNTDRDDSSRSCPPDRQVDLGALVDAFSKILASELESAVEKFRTEFSEQAQTTEGLSYQQRKEGVEALMDLIEEVIVEVMHEHGGVPKETTREHLAGVKEGIVSIVVFIGDLVARYPWIFEMLLSLILSWILPQNWILRIILRCFGLGPIGPTKGSAAAWAQRIFFGPNVTKGSWFAYLQQVAMKGGK